MTRRGRKPRLTMRERAAINSAAAAAAKLAHLRRRGSQLDLFGVSPVEREWFAIRAAALVEVVGG